MTATVDFDTLLTAKLVGKADVTAVNDRVATETQARVDAIGQLNQAVQTSIGQVSQAVDTESRERQAQVAQIGATVAQESQTRQDADVQEAQYRTQGDARTGQRIDQLTADVGVALSTERATSRDELQAERSDRLTAEELIGGRIAAETSARIAAAAAARHRPGDGPTQFTASAVTGSAEGLPPLPQSLIAFGDNGYVARFAGAGVIAARRWSALERGRIRRFRFVIQRRANSADPSNHTLRVALALLDQSGNRLPGEDGTLILKDFHDLRVSDGRQEIAFTVSRGGIGAMHVVPYAAVHARGYVEGFGNDGLTDVEVIDDVDITDLVLVPDISADALARLAALEGDDLPERMDALESAAQAPNSLTFATRTDAAAAQIAVSVTTLSVRGLVSAGDGQASTYRRVSAGAAAAGPAGASFSSADGAWWLRVDGSVRSTDLSAQALDFLWNTALVPAADDPSVAKTLGNWVSQLPSILGKPFVDVLRDKIPRNLRAGILLGTASLALADDLSGYVQQAFDEVEAAGGGLVIICAGRWPCTFSIGPRTTLVMHGFATRIVQPNGKNTDVVQTRFAREWLDRCVTADVAAGAFTIPISSVAAIAPTHVLYVMTQTVLAGVPSFDAVNMTVAANGVDAVNKTITFTSALPADVVKGFPVTSYHVPGAECVTILDGYIDGNKKNQNPVANNIVAPQSAASVAPLNIVGGEAILSGQAFLDNLYPEVWTSGDNTGRSVTITGWRRRKNGTRFIDSVVVPLGNGTLGYYRGVVTARMRFNGIISVIPSAPLSGTIAVGWPVGSSSGDGVLLFGPGIKASGLKIQYCRGWGLRFGFVIGSSGWNSQFKGQQQYLNEIDIYDCRGGYYGSGPVDGQIGRIFVNFVPGIGIYLNRWAAGTKIVTGHVCGGNVGPDDLGAAIILHPIYCVLIEGDDCAIGNVSMEEASQAQLGLLANNVDVDGGIAFYTDDKTFQTYGIQFGDIALGWACGIARVRTEVKQCRRAAANFEYLDPTYAGDINITGSVSRDDNGLAIWPAYVGSPPSGGRLHIEIAGATQDPIHRDGIKPCFFVYGSNKGALGVQSWAVEQVDNDSSFDRTTGRFTARVPGVFRFSAAVLTASAFTGQQAVFAFRKNGTNVAGNQGYGATAGHCQSSADAMLNLVPGDVVELYAFVPLDISTEGLSSFTGMLVS